MVGPFEAKVFVRFWLLGRVRPCMRPRCAGCFAPLALGDIPPAEFAMKIALEKQAA